MAKEFNIKSSDSNFRIPKISPIDLLAIGTQLNFDEFKPTRNLFAFALEHIDVKMGEKWVPVKTKNSEVYMPMGIETNYAALQELIDYFFENELAPVFTKSNE